MNEKTKEEERKVKKKEETGEENRVQKGKEGKQKRIGRDRREKEAGKVDIMILGIKYKLEFSKGTKVREGKREGNYFKDLLISW